MDSYTELDITASPWETPQGIELSRHTARVPADQGLPITSKADGDEVPVAYTAYFCCHPGPTARATERKRLETQEANALLIASAPDLYRALAVMTRTPAIREWLESNDPMALAQAEAALRKAKGKRIK